MFDDTNPYTLRTEVAGGITRCFVSFTDGQAIRRETEVMRQVYQGLCRFVKHERNLRRWDERHIERSELSEETLNDRARHTPKGVEEDAIEAERNETLYRAIAQLPEIQRRRFLLRCESGLSYERIAELEGCTFQAVAKSVKAAKNAVRIFFERQG